MDASCTPIAASWNIERSSDQLQHFVVSRLAGLTDIDVEL
jgi:hypothetical protein